MVECLPISDRAPAKLVAQTCVRSVGNERGIMNEGAG